MNFDALKSYRQYYNLRQSQVCDGLCPLSIYSRIEHGQTVPAFPLAEALFGRMGQESCTLSPVLSQADVRLTGLRLEIENMILNERLDEAEAALTQFEAFLPKGQLLYQQILLYLKAWLNHPDHMPSDISETEAEGQKEAAKELLLAAWRVTKKSNIVSEEELYTPLEIRILLDLIHLESPAWNRTVLFSQLELLIQKIDQYFMGRSAIELRTACMWEIICQGEKEWDDHHILEKTDEAIRSLSNWYDYRTTAKLHRKKAQVLARLTERPGDNAALREQCILECRMCYHIYETLHQDFRMQEISRFCLEKTGVDITVV